MHAIFMQRTGSKWMLDIAIPYSLTCIFSQGAAPIPRVSARRCAGAVETEVKGERKTSNSAAALHTLHHPGFRDHIQQASPPPLPNIPAALQLFGSYVASLLAAWPYMRSAFQRTAPGTISSAYGCSYGCARAPIDPTLPHHTGVQSIDN